MVGDGAGQVGVGVDARDAREAREVEEDVFRVGDCVLAAPVRVVDVAEREPSLVFPLRDDSGEAGVAHRARHVGRAHEVSVPSRERVVRCDTPLDEREDRVGVGAREHHGRAHAVVGERPRARRVVGGHGRGRAACPTRRVAIHRVEAEREGGRDRHASHAVGAGPTERQGLDVIAQRREGRAGDLEVFG